MDGTYQENIDIDKKLTIRSEKGSSSTFVTAEDPTDYVFSVTADNVTIDGLTISGATETQMAGIYLYGSENSSIVNNICSGNNNGIYLSYSDNITVSNNTCSDNTNGIFLYRSDDNTISNNTCNTNDYGILIEGSSRIITTGNTCSENGVGIRVLPSLEVTISNNICEDNDYGLYFSYYTGYTTDDIQNIINSNTLENNSKANYYFEDISGTLDSSSDSGTCFITSASWL
jgi:parallel beta-helix repeat protein